MILVLFLIGLNSFALDPNVDVNNSANDKALHEKILKHFDERLSKISNKPEWQKYLKEHSADLPALTADSAPVTIVNKEDLKIENDTYPIGIGNRSAFVKTTLAKYKEFLTTPELFQHAYGLDGPAVVADAPKTPTEFLGRIYKKVPGIEDQDYTLKYKVVDEKKILFIRASLQADKKQFALRDNLKILEEVPGGVIAREISIVYPLRWYVRVFYGATMDIMKKEMTKISLVEKCILESEPKTVLLPETSKECWKKISK